MNVNINKEVAFRQLGLIDYQEAWNYQEKLFAEIVDLKISNRKQEESSQKPTPNYLLLCQHPHVYTLGKSGEESHLLLNTEGLQQANACY